MSRTTDYKVREATIADALDLTLLARNFVKESGNTHLGWDQKKVYSLAETAITQDNFFACVLDHEGDVVGGLVAFATDTFFGDTKQAVELMWYVSKDHRGKSAVAYKMVDMYEEWAKAQGVSVMNLINIEALDPEDKVRNFYLKKGFKPVENTFAKEI